MLNTLISLCVIPVTAWKQEEVILETVSFPAFLFSQMNIEKVKVWVKMSKESFVWNWGCGKYAVFNRNALVSLVLERGPTNKKKSPQS